MSDFTATSTNYGRLKVASHVHMLCSEWLSAKVSERISAQEFIVNLQREMYEIGKELMQEHAHE